jgi:hypothetical protein
MPWTRGKQNTSKAEKQGKTSIIAHSNSQIVRAKAYGGEVLERRVVADLGRTVVICSESEYQTAESEGREPEGVGFPRTDISSNLPTKAERGA